MVPAANIQHFRTIVKSPMRWHRSGSYPSRSRRQPDHIHSLSIEKIAIRRPIIWKIPTEYIKFALLWNPPVPPGGRRGYRQPEKQPAPHPPALQTMTTILQKMNELYPLSDTTVAQLKEHLSQCRFPKKHLLVQEGVYGKWAYFIEQGMTRSFWLVNGEEITTSFSWEGDIVFSMDELYYNKVSEEFVETIEETVAYRIALTDLERLFRDNIELANWGRIIHQNEYRRLHRSHQERLTLPARERYEAFRQQFPQVCRRAQLGHIASYLGITQPTLSRLRRKK